MWCKDAPRESKRSDWVETVVEQSITDEGVEG